MTSPDRQVPASVDSARELIRGLRKQYISLCCRGSFVTGKEFAIGRRAAILSPGYFRAGERVRIGQDFLCEVDVDLGNDILISSRVSMVGDDHRFDIAGKTVFESGRNAPQLQTLEGDNLIGNGTIIVGNVRIGLGAIVGAGSVVTRDLPPYWICVGRPARPLRPRFTPEAG